MLYDSYITNLAKRYEIKPYSIEKLLENYKNNYLYGTR